MLLALGCQWPLDWRQCSAILQRDPSDLRRKTRRSSRATRVAFVQTMQCSRILNKSCEFVPIFPDEIPITGSSRMNSINWINDFISIENCHRHFSLFIPLLTIIPPFTVPSPSRIVVHYKIIRQFFCRPKTIQYQFIIDIMARKIIDHYRCIERGFNFPAQGDKSTDWMNEAAMCD